jgi:hypothetical protein
VKAIDSVGNRIQLRSGLTASGPKRGATSRVKSYGAETWMTEFSFRSRARWYERAVNDSAGNLLASAVETTALSRLPARLHSLGIDLSLPVIEAEQGENVGVDGTTTWSRAPYASVTDWTRTGPISAGQDTVVERLEHVVKLTGGGLQPGVRVTQTALANGLLRTEDSLGGSRTESFDEARLLIEARDGVGPIAQVETDSNGVPSILYLGAELASVPACTRRAAAAGGARLHSRPLPACGLSLRRLFWPVRKRARHDDHP